MPDNLAIVLRIISEHHSIRQHVRLVGDSVNDIEALFSLQKAHSGWAQSSVGTLSEKQKQLEQLIIGLEEGLKNHFYYEEKFLPPILGEIVMKALLLEHHDIGKELERAKAAVTDTKLEGLPQNELLAKKTELQQMISNICQTVEHHASDEELILKMVKRALEAKP